MRQHEISKHWHHERVCSFGQELLNPRLKTSPESECRAEHFVLSEQNKEDAYGQTKTSEGSRVRALVRVIMFQIMWMHTTFNTSRPGSRGCTFQESRLIY